MRVEELEGNVGNPLSPVLVSDPGDAPIEEDTSGRGPDAPPESGIPEQ